MARKKRSTLPAITEADHALHPERLRRTARGYAWKCAYCGQFASSETNAGKYVCRAHGGVTARQRDPEARQRAQNEGKPLSRPPGRPIERGHAARNRVRADELVAEYRAKQLDADATDDDMLYLRAYLQLRRLAYAGLEPLCAPLASLGSALQGMGDDAELRSLLVEVRQVLRAFDRSTAGIERRHEQIIRMAKIRADTRVKNKAAHELQVFVIMLSRMQTIFEETLPPELHQALQARFKKELDELPRGVVEGTASVKV